MRVGHAHTNVHHRSCSIGPIRQKAADWKKGHSIQKWLHFLTKQLMLLLLQTSPELDEARPIWLLVCVLGMSPPTALSNCPSFLWRAYPLLLQ